MIQRLRSLSRVPRATFYLASVWIGVIAIAFTLPFIYGRAMHIDFVGFYCAGETVAHHADPYRQMPLYSCEYRVTSEDQFPYNTTIPAPLPPYAFLPFAALSRLPFVPAYGLFTTISLLALAVGCVTLRRLTGAGMMLVLAAVTSSAWDNIVKGQPVPLVFLAIVLAGWSLRRGRHRLAGLLAASTMIEPHIGLATCAALFLWIPKTRLALTFSGIALAGISLITVSPPAAWSYLTAVLPLHAASEAAWSMQLSLVSPLVLFGVSMPTALSIGMAQYLLTVSVGIVVSAMAAKRFNAPECFAFVPTLFAVVGGTYIHNNLLLLAVPAAVLVTMRLKTAVSCAALAGMALYWLALDNFVEALIIVISVYTIVLWWSKRELSALAAAGIISISALGYEQVRPVFQTPNMTSHIAESAYAEESWAMYVRTASPSAEGQRVAFAVKIPTWTALLALSTLAAGFAFRRPSWGDKRRRSGPPIRRFASLSRPLTWKGQREWEAVQEKKL